MIHSYEELVQRLRSNVLHEIRKGLPLLMKQVPFAEESNGLDPRVRDFLLHENLEARYPMEVKDIIRIREKESIQNKDLSKNIIEEQKEVHVGHNLKIRIYNRSNEKKPAIIFYHGGGFFENDSQVMNNPCKLLAERTGAVVVAIEYRLAPEYPYKDGIEDCLKGIRYVYENDEKLNIDREKIGLVGESVGGNLALGVQLLSEEEDWEIKHIGLWYPLVDLSDVSRNDWDIERYDLTADEKLIRKELTMLRDSLYLIQNLYLEKLEDVMQPLVSPLLRESKKQLPPITMVTAEFDFLRMQEEQFSRQLIEENVEVRHIEYKGMEHAFVKHLGDFPQAEDAIVEVANHFRSIIDRI